MTHRRTSHVRRKSLNASSRYGEASSSTRRLGGSVSQALGGWLIACVLFFFYAWFNPHEPASIAMLLVFSTGAVLVSLLLLWRYPVAHEAMDGFFIVHVTMLALMALVGVLMA